MKKRIQTTVPVRRIQNMVHKTDVTLFEIGHLQENNQSDGLIVKPHRHDYYHIMYIKNGIGEHVIDFKTYAIKPHSMFFISPGQVHALQIDSNAEGYVISFNSEFYLLKDDLQKLLEFPFFHSLYNAPVVYLPSKNDKILSTLEEIFEENTSQEKNLNLIRALLEVLLLRSSRMYTQPLNANNPAYLTYQIRKLESLIDIHFKAYRLLNDYAELMHISPKHLNSLCKKALNKTVTNLIHERSIIEAKRLLLFTNNTIADIAFELGFADKSYFMRFFKKNTNITADGYRNTNQKF